MVERREPSPFYVFRMCFVFLKQTCEIKSQISVNKVLDIEQIMLKYYLKYSYEIILNLNSSPAPFSLHVPIPQDRQT